MLSATDGSSWQYDSLGNMIYNDDGTDEWDYEYSPENRLMSDNTIQ
ncbi:MAG: hypothetical protein GF350_06590 [Chitinivibrionales bacterium]|nr:hypothetical protein [Chitinivibrionales bacterium]